MPKYNCLKCSIEIFEIDFENDTGMFLCGKCFIFWHKNELDYYTDYKKFVKLKPKEILDIRDGNKK